MRYVEIAPSAAAARFVKTYWFLEDDAPSLDAQRIVPDGRAELILNLGTPYEARTLQPKCFLMGQISGPLMVRATGPVRIAGVRFHPHMAGAFLRIPIAELTDEPAIALGDISKPLCGELESLEELGSPVRCTRELNRIFGWRAVDGDSAIAAAIRELEQGTIRISTAADQSRLSARQFERRFVEAVGIPPKLFCRMQRFQRVFRASEEPDASWADAAVLCGYYDQAHLIRDFREFAGKPPAALLAEETDLAKHFVLSAQA